MKTIIVMILSLALTLLFCSCGNEYTYTEQNEQSGIYTFSETNAEEVALKELYKELNNLKYPIFDIGQTRYSIGSIERQERAAGTVYMVYGTYTLYDKYGDYISEYVGKKFSVTVYTNGIAYCDLE